MHPLLLAVSSETFVNLHRVFPFFQQVTEYCMAAGALGRQRGKRRLEAAVVGVRGKSR